MYKSVDLRSVCLMVLIVEKVTNGYRKITMA